MTTALRLSYELRVTGAGEEVTSEATDPADIERRLCRVVATLMRRPVAGAEIEVLVHGASDVAIRVFACRYRDGRWWTSTGSEWVRVEQLPLPLRQGDAS